MKLLLSVSAERVILTGGFVAVQLFEGSKAKEAMSLTSGPQSF